MAEPREDTGATVAGAMAFYERAGGFLVPLAATLLAFTVGGLVVVATGSNPFGAYKAIFDGTGLNWFLPWVLGDERREAAGDLQQTLLLTTPLILTALAVAFAFRCGLFNIGGPLQGNAPATPRSNDIVDEAKLWPIWGALQPLHAGIFIALFALVVYHLLLNRTTLGYEVRAVGFNPEAARYGGISVSRNYFLAMAISGSFAGLAGAMDMLGWKFHVAENDFPVGAVGFIGIAVALLGRNKAVGILFAALLFGALQTGTAPRQLDPEVFNPELATNLATIIQALIILFVGAELLVVHIWGVRRHLFPGARRIQSKLQQ